MVNKHSQEATEHANKKASDLFNSFIQSETCSQTFTKFLEFCQAANLRYPPSSASSSIALEHIIFYSHLKKKLSSSWKAKSIFSKLDKRFHGKEYCLDAKSNEQKAGEDLKVLIIGAGPCGLRTAIEMACLGAKVVVVEKRDSFSRNNILHLWPFLITDLKTLGAKKIYGRFCAGSLDHISIRQLQLILLKISLILGVEVIFNVTFERLVSPLINEENENLSKGWTAEVNPTNHPISNYEFDVIVGADGKRNTLKGFKRKEFRGKLAIGLTVNFINRNTTAEAKVEEISGVAYIFNQEFFKNLHNETGIDLENIVYYKGETHYFVMTAKKHSLLAKGVLRQDYDETAKLLSYSNVDQKALEQYTREAADFSTHRQLPNLEFAFNQYGQADVALFDFTCMYAAENAALFREEKGCRLLSCLVGDSLLEPFWPMGTGCARGFLASFDAAWMIKQWSVHRGEGLDCSAELQVLSERESIYRLLHQTTPENMVKKTASYTIDPASRYMNLNRSFVKPHQVVKYYLTDRKIDAVVATEAHHPKSAVARLEDEMITLPGTHFTRNVSMVRSKKLLSWCQKVTAVYDVVKVENLTSSWRNGMALCAIIHRFRPDLINWNQLDAKDVEKNNQMAFTIAEEQLGISPVMSGKEMATCETVDKLLMLTYLSQFYEIFKYETPADEIFDFDTDLKAPTEEAPESPPKSPHRKLSLTSPIGLLIRFTQHMKRRSSTPKKPGDSKRKKSDDLDPPSVEKMPVLKEVDEEKYKGTDSVSTLSIGNVEVKLRQKSPGDTARVNQRASDRISALSNQLISQLQQNSPETVVKPIKRQVDLSEIPASSNQCYFCHQCVHVFERTGAEGVFFHRNCFVCAHCGNALRQGAYIYEENTGKFFCHKLCQKDAETCAIVVSPTTDFKFSEFEGDEADGIRSYRTPERIELENIRMSMIDDPQELPEEDVTKHNLVGGEITLKEEESISDSSDDDDWDLVPQIGGKSDRDGAMIDFSQLDEDSDASLADISTDADASDISLADISSATSEQSEISLADISTDEDYEDEIGRIVTKTHLEKSLPLGAAEKTNIDLVVPLDKDAKRQYSSSASQSNMNVGERVSPIDSAVTSPREAWMPDASSGVNLTDTAVTDNGGTRLVKDSLPALDNGKTEEKLPEESADLVGQKLPIHSKKPDSIPSSSSESELDEQEVLKLLEEKPSPDIARKVVSSLKKEMREHLTDKISKESAIKPTRKTLPRPPLTDSVLIKASSTPEHKSKALVRHGPSQSFDESMLRRQNDVASDDPQRPPMETKRSFDSFEQRIEERKSLRNKWLEEDSNFGKPLTRSQSDRRPWEPNYRDKQAKSATATATMTTLELGGKPLPSKSSIPTAWEKTPKPSEDSLRNVPSVSDATKVPPIDSENKSKDVTKKRSLPPLPQVTTGAPGKDGDVKEIRKQIDDEEVEYKKKLMREKIERMKAKSLMKRALGPLPEKKGVTEVDGTVPAPATEANKNKEARVKRILPVPKVDVLPTNPPGTSFKNKPTSEASDKETTKMGKTTTKFDGKAPDDNVQNDKNKQIGHGAAKTKPISGGMDRASATETKRKPLFRLTSRKKLEREDKSEDDLDDQSRVSSISDSTNHAGFPSTSHSNEQEANPEESPPKMDRKKVTRVAIRDKIKRKAELAARRQAKLEAQQRLRRAQTIQRSLEEVEIKQRRLEERGVELEKLLRSDKETTEESKHMLEWFELVQEKNALLRYENELLIHQRELQLEDTQSRLQQQYRDIMAIDHKRSKTSAQLREEKEILQKMMDVVDQREELRAILDEQKSKERDETFTVEKVVLEKYENKEE